MRVASIEIRYLRILDSVSVEFSPGVNLVVGPNGSGKSSLLEAVHILGAGRSFRSHRLRDVVTHEKSSLRIVGRTIGSDGISETTGLEHTSEGLRIRRGGVDIRAASDLASFLPTVTITPDSHRLITDGADLRRRIVDRLLFHVEPTYLNHHRRYRRGPRRSNPARGPRAGGGADLRRRIVDRLLFHVDPTYLNHHRRYRRALRQRNAAIRSGAGISVLGGWHLELAEAGELLTEQRVRYLGRALPTMNEVVGALVGKPVDIQFYRGWDSELSLAQACECSLTDDRVRGHTLAGPHRADLRLTIGGRPLRHSLSRGEAKLFVTAVAVAQVLDLTSVLGYPPVVLVDDIASELDSDSRSRCLAELNATGAQLFLTAVSDVGMQTSDVEGARLFHVERGHVRQVV